MDASWKMQQDIFRRQVAEGHIKLLEECKQVLQEMEDYYGDHLMITDLLEGKNVQPFGDDPDYQEEYEALRRETAELEKPLFTIWQANREEKDHP